MMTLNEQRKAIYLAISSSDLNEVKKLIELDSGILNLDSPAGTPLHIATRKGNYGIVNLLLSKGADVNKKGGVSGGNPLNIAACEGNVQIVDALLRKNVELDVGEPERNPLFGAIHKGSFEVVKKLIEAGIDYKVKYKGKSIKDMDALAFAKQYDRTEIADYLARLVGSEINGNKSEGKKKLDVNIKTLPLDEQLQIYKLELKDSLKNHYKKITQLYSDIYGYSLYSVDGLESILPVANRLKGIPVNPSDEDYVYYRYGAEEWNEWDEFGLFEKVNQIKDEILSGYENNSSEKIDLILQTSLDTLCELEKEGCFGLKTDDRFLGICIADSDDKIMLKSVKLLNTEKVFKLYASQFSD